MKMNTVFLQGFTATATYSGAKPQGSHPQDYGQLRNEGAAMQRRHPGHVVSQDASRMRSKSNMAQTHVELMPSIIRKQLANALRLESSELVSTVCRKIHIGPPLQKRLFADAETATLKLAPSFAHAAGLPTGNREFGPPTSPRTVT